MGQAMSEDHWPPVDALGVTGFDGADAGPFPTVFVALTVNV